MARVLFIGGTGEISFACVQAAVAAGHQVTVFNRGNSTEVLPSNVETIFGDFNDESQCTKLTEENFDTVIQFIAYDSSTIARDIENFSGNCKQYLFISTASAYQKPWNGEPITEEVPLDNPFWEYSQMKAQCEDLLMRAHAENSFPITIVRPSHTYRKRLPGTCFPGDHMAWRILNDKPIIVQDDGESLWTLTHAEDFARALVGLIGNEAAIGEDFHITSDSARSWNEIVEHVSSVLSKPVSTVHVSTDTLIDYSEFWRGPLKGDKANSLVFDNSKIKSVVYDWQCQVVLEEGLAKTVEFTKDLMSGGYTPDEKLDGLIDRIISER